jgi:Concanavalin A-like lectin/glucanases superfamily
MALHRTLAPLALLLASCSPGGLNVVGRAPNSLRQDVIAYWSCDNVADSNNPTLVDDSGNQNTGTILGATLTPGHFGNALHFESGNSVFVGNFPQAHPSWSVSLWVRPAAWASPSPTDNSGDTYDAYVTLISTEIIPQGGWEMDVIFRQREASTWKYNFAFLNPSDAGVLKYQWAETNDFEVGAWTHLVAVVDSDAMKLQFYENGVLSIENPITSLIQPGSDTLYLGTWTSGGRYFVGDLDDIVIYGRALTQTEVGTLYTQPAPATPG